ncbi:Protein of unknown function [Bacillus thuringiensis]|uniref:Uncharacterized protein n=1 Tax=Bacillus thuringiensis TaxID=1428 RepID=A0A1C4E2N3_BACTU|nr:Protein of unknown function [Bacillus thuringiensis]
MFNAEAIQH